MWCMQGIYCQFIYNSLKVCAECFEKQREIHVCVWIYSLNVVTITTCCETALAILNRLMFLKFLMLSQFLFPNIIIQVTMIWSHPQGYSSLIFTVGLLHSPRLGEWALHTNESSMEMSPSPASFIVLGNTLDRKVGVPIATATAAYLTKTERKKSVSVWGLPCIQSGAGHSERGNGNALPGLLKPLDREVL